MKSAFDLISGWLSVWKASEMGSGGSSESVLEGEAQFESERASMISEQLLSGDRHISDPRLLQAMHQVPRHEFIPDSARAHAYQDSPLPIGFGQTISQPFIVALMTEQLNLKPTDRILEIGTGSGYQAAILSRLVDRVYTIEIIEPLARRAGDVLRRLSFANVYVRVGDGYAGWPEAAPFDGIIVTCAPERIPTALVEQLAEGGRFIIPVGAAANQELILMHKQGGVLSYRTVLPVRFVPMTGQTTTRE